ncbi:ABC transporter ATP-binding protein [Hyalangium versicolor]|uniref:ABC transporter ATP-binding protein n=1 Tax=Hyalangium versicolor TaxID=2861190 RepID=UPI001CD01653|nr:nitrate/sulfonate/bicarbonate ABC transporter ATP-binding protein [Hyalangium versicolor]
METLDKPPLCEVRNVSQEFPQPRGTPLRVLGDVTLAVKPDEVIALLGPSGCGKSTLLRILAGLTQPTRGAILYHGQPLRGLNPGVGFVFQSFALFPWMTVAENVESALRPTGLAREEIRARTQKVITLVGLSGAEEAYPRELSGGMKQRVGMARALSLNPEMLFMDEPFSQVDALTAESLRAEVLDIWAAKDRNPSSIVMVSHDIKEVAAMADRIVVLGTRPGRIRTIVENTLPRPRNYRAPAFLQLVDRLHDIITGSEMPDAPAPAPGAGALIEPLPAARASEIVGLLEYLDSHGGREEVFRIVSDTHREFGVVIAVVNAAELLNFVDTPRRTVVLLPLGERFIRASPTEQKALWREQLLRLALFKQVAEALSRNEDHRLDADFILETIAMRMPYENYEGVFETFVSWARYGDLFTYDEDTKTLALK